MATWTNIPDSVLEPGKPARSVDALALRDNAIAIAEGAAGAPRIQTNAIQNGAITNVKIANMDAGKLNSGTVPGARIPTNHGGVGTYAFVVPVTNGPVTYTWGQTVAGGNLAPALVEARTGGEVDVRPTWSPGGVPGLAGTWRIMGATASKANQMDYPRIPNLAVRIS